MEGETGGQEPGCSLRSAKVPPGSAAPLWPERWTEIGLLW